MPKVLFKHSGEIYNTEKTTLEEPLSSDDFINHGVDITTIDKSLYQEMYSQFDVLAYSEENEAEDEITLNIETFTPDITYNYSVSKYNLEEVSISPDSLTVNYDIDTDPKDYPMDTNVSIEINGVEYYSNNHNLPDSNSIEISSTEFKDGENTLSITIDNNSYEETIEKTTETINKVLFKSNGTIYKYNDGFFTTDLTEPLTVEEYLQHGLSYENVRDIKEEHLAMLDNQFKVKYFSDEYNDAILYLDLFTPELVMGDILITPTNLWEDAEGNVEDCNIKFTATSNPEGYVFNYDYSIELNNEEVETGSSVTGDEVSLNILGDKFIEEDNNLKIIFK